jgi:DNA polymerase phi
LFSKGATDGQKFRGFTVFQKTLETLAEQEKLMKALFSKNLMVCLVNQASKEDRYLHRAAVKALKAIENTTASHPGSVPTILNNLIGNNGLYNFDPRTSSRTVEKVLQHTKPEDGKVVIDILKQPLLRAKR